MFTNHTNLVRNLFNFVVNFSLMYQIKASQTYLQDLEIDALLVKQPGLLLQTFPSHGWLSLFPNKIQHPSIINHQFARRTVLLMIIEIVRNQMERSVSIPSDWNIISGSPGGLIEICRSVLTNQFVALIHFNYVKKSEKD